MKKRWWVSWNEYAEDNRPLHDPPNEKVLAWWESGIGDGYTAICAIVEAGTVSAAKRGIEEEWPVEEGTSREWRFFEARALDMWRRRRRDAQP